MPNKSQRQYLIGSFIFLLLTGGAFAFLYIQIRNNNIASQEAEIEWNSESSKLNEIKSLNLSIQTIDTEKALFESHFLKSSDIVSFLDTIESAAKDVNVTAEIVSVDDVTDTTSLTIGIRSSGTFEGLYKFLILLENLKYEIDIASMELNRASVGEVEGVIDIKPEWKANFKIRLLSFVK
ncbi:MAG: hypothetical protein AAB438_04080 [Patescibacteria group bacterium]